MALTIAMLQLATHVGDLAGNADSILAAWHDAADRGAQLAVTPELALTGYLPQDHLLRTALVDTVATQLQRLAAEGPPACALVVGHPRVTASTDPFVRGAAGEDWQGAPEGMHVDDGTPRLRNSATVITAGKALATYDKWRLPNMGVFDEARWFTAGSTTCTVDLHGHRVAVSICEDLWTDGGSLAALSADEIDLVVNLNASPFEMGKRELREHWAAHHARSLRAPLLYVNMAGGQDEVVFDGDSFAVDAAGVVVARGAEFAQDTTLVTLGADRVLEPSTPTTPRLDPHDAVWRACTTGLRDYARQNGFSTALVAVSGGIDSAVTCAMAVDALGAGNVRAVALPTTFSSDHAFEDAQQLCNNLGLPLATMSIEQLRTLATDDLLSLLDDQAFSSEGFDGTTSKSGIELAQENVQSRLRGLAMMFLSNATGALLVSTGNKSEYAVGYATLYGDMCGGYAPLKDVPKTLVWRIARRRNAAETVIPERSVAKPPSAELRHDQRDTDSLPDYETLDRWIHALIIDRVTVEDLASQEDDPDAVRRVSTQLHGAEHKRRQSPIGPKITRRAFDRDRRVPITTLAP